MHIFNLLIYNYLYLIIILNAIIFKKNVKNIWLCGKNALILQSQNDGNFGPIV